MTSDTNFWQEYEDFTDTTAAYPSDQEFVYVCLGLCDEIGELVEKISLDAPIEDVESEVGDVLWYATRLKKYIDPEGTLHDYMYIAGLALKTDLDQDGQPHLTEVQTSLVVSAAKIAGRAKKFLRDGVLKREVVVENLVRVLMSLGCLAFYFQGFNLQKVARGNITKLSDRKDRGVLKGDGDNR